MSDTRRRAFLLGLRADGSPTCHPMVAVEQDGEFVFNAYRKSAKMRNFLRDPRAAAVLLESWQTPPAAARRLAGVMEEIDGAAAAAGGDGAQLQAVPDRVLERVRQRVESGKRTYFRLRSEC